MKIRRQYKEKLEVLENASKILKNLASVCPKVDALIELDEANTGLENKLFYSEFHVRKSPGYIWSPQLSISRVQPIPDKMQDKIYNEMYEEEIQTISGMIPEIDIAFLVSNNVFSYWSLGSKNQIVKTIELDKQIMSVGLVKPPSGYYTFLKWDHVLLLGSDHNLIPWEISFTNQYNRGSITHITKLDGKIKCENINHDKIVYTSNSRIFTGWKDGKINELKFETVRTWFTNKLSRSVTTEAKKQSSWLWRLVPKIFNSSTKDIAKIAVDDSRHLIYTLTFREYDEEMDIKPCEIEVLYLGAFGEGFRKVTSISQLELSKIYNQNPVGNNKIPLQVVGLHNISVTESPDIHFMLVTSIGQRIYVNLDVKQYNTEKVKEAANFDYTSYFNEIPNGNWAISGITNPPHPKDITGISNVGLNCCSEIGFDHTELWVTDSTYDRGCVFMSALNRSTNRKVLLYINDSETTIKSKHELNSRNGATEKFWTISVGENKHILDIQHKPLELYIDEDILNVTGYFKKKPNYDHDANKKVKFNEYQTWRKHIYSKQVYLPGEEYLIMQNTEVYTMIMVINTI